MGKGARARRTWSTAAVVTSVALVVAACGGSSSKTPAAAGASAGGGSGSGGTTLEFSQWWEPELPANALRGMMDTFEAANPGIKVKLLSGPYASTKEQTIASGASGTMADVVGLDGAWVADLVKQGALADMSALMKDASYDDSQLAATIKVDDTTAMIPVVNFVYPLFVNDDLLAKAGVTTPPTTRSEFLDAAKKVSALGGDVKGWALPLSLEAPNGIQNDVMAWNWASGGSMLKDGKPDLQNAEVKETVEFVKSLWDAKAVAPGGLTMKEQDKVEEFTNGRVGMMIDSLAHVTLIRESNKNLKFTLAAIPAKDGYSGKRGIPYASWGIGVSDKSKHKAEAWKLVQFLMDQKTNSELSTVANAFPGNKNSTPDFVTKDPTLKSAFDIYKAGYPANEFTGLPVAEELMRSFDEGLQKLLSGDGSVDSMLKTAQQTWTSEF